MRKTVMGDHGLRLPLQAAGYRSQDTVNRAGSIRLALTGLANLPLR